MTAQNEVKTLHDLTQCNWENLTFNRDEIEEILNCAKPENSVNPYFVGTDVYKWLSSFEAMDTDFYKENKDESFEILLHDNSYNWNGHSNVDIDFKILSNEDDELFAMVKIHIGTDIRAGYTSSILLNLDSYRYGIHDNGMMTFLDCINEYSSDYGYVAINGVDYNIDSTIAYEEVSIYNHETGESYDNFYECFYNSESVAALNEEIKEALIEYFKENNIKTGKVK